MPVSVPVRNHVVRSFALLIAACASLSVAVGQESVPTEAAVPSAVDKAFASWNKAKGSKQKNAALLRLGALDAPRVTELLLAELERAGDDKYALTVLRAIGGHPRTEALSSLRDLVLSAGSPVSHKKSAALAIARQGNRGIDLLVNVASRDGVKSSTRDACLRGLAGVNDARAWRGLAKFALRGNAPSRRAVLGLLDKCRDVRSVTQTRLKLLKDTDAAIASMAWRQLAVAGHDRAAWAFEDLVDKHGLTPPVAVRTQLVAGLPYVLESDYFEAMLRLASTKSSLVRKQLAASVPKLGNNLEFVEWLIESALESRDPLEREVAMQVLAAAPATAVGELVARVREKLRKSLRPSALDVVIGLNRLLAKDPTWKDDLLALAQSKNLEVKIVGLALLLEVGGDQAIECAQRGVDHKKSWRLRSVSYRYLARFRSLSSIPLLIARADREHGRLEGELGDALFVHTGVRCWQRSEWEAWWRKNQEAHKLPAWQSVSSIAKKAGASGTVAYYGIPLASTRVAFLVDVSGSMRAKIGTDKKLTRLDGAKQQLGQVIEKMNKDFEFNVIPYQSSVSPVWDRLRRAAKANKSEMVAAITRLKAAGGTNIYGALQRAFDDPEVDTIYLLSDGQPSGGEINDIGEIADAVRRWNYQRQVVVHGIAIGTKSTLLKRLAEESGGQYVFVRR